MVKKKEKKDHSTNPQTETQVKDAPTAEGENIEKEQESMDSLAKRLAEANDKYMRSRAELDNYRKRMQRDSGDIREYTKASTVEEFLSVFDHFQMAMDHVDQSPDFETLKQGMQMILGEFKKTFENLGVKAIEAEGQEFDPNEHEAVAEENSEEMPPGKVLRQWKCGYRLGDRLLRPATVIVSSGPPEKKKEEREEDKGQGKDNLTP